MSEWPPLLVSIFASAAIGYLLGYWNARDRSAKIMLEQHRVEPLVSLAPLPEAPREKHHECQCGQVYFVPLDDVWHDCPGTRIPGKGLNGPCDREVCGVDFYGTGLPSKVVSRRKVNATLDVTP